MRSAIALAISLAFASASADEVVLDAAPRIQLTPSHPAPEAAYPLVAAVDLVVDRSGHARDLKLAPGLPYLIGAALRSLLEREAAFWPAQGQCRFLEQPVHLEFEFGPPADGAHVTMVAFDPGRALPAGPPQVDQADAYFFVMEGDRRHPLALDGHAEGETPPRPLDRVMPRIPTELRHSTGYVGYVWMSMEVSAKGNPKDIRVTDAWSRVDGQVDHLAAEAVRALRQTKFAPATRAGAPVARRSCHLSAFGVVPWMEGSR